MGDVFKFLAGLEEDHAQMRRTTTLEKGVLYETYQFSIQAPNDEAQYSSLVAYIKDNGMKFFMYMPSKYSTFTEVQVKELNQEIEKNRPPTIFHYGRMGKANIVQIQKCGQGVDLALKTRVEKLEKFMATETFSSPESSPKRPAPSAFGYGSACVKRFDLKDDGNSQ